MHDYGRYLLEVLNRQRRHEGRAYLKGERGLPATLLAVGEARMLVGCIEATRRAAELELARMDYDFYAALRLAGCCERDDLDNRAMGNAHRRLFAAGDARLKNDEQCRGK